MDSTDAVVKKLLKKSKSKNLPSMTSEQAKASAMKASENTDDESAPKEASEIDEKNEVYSKANLNSVKVGSALGKLSSPVSGVVSGSKVDLSSPMSGVVGGSLKSGKSIEDMNKDIESMKSQTAKTKQKTKYLKKLTEEYKKQLAQ